ncbi:hypothetical protein QCB45_04690 [Thiomicrorhabdus sp. ZW0627]|uniref:O-antigen ligase family protein n=1 Tax=Thiomicrorhabdus sp. ZW0627 TaxID=3039774 RepID=UPI0024364F52|nr:hypothetical protein [Thiomicrorhabdus sp. ZW0627]MDG6773619.1 hypothetical protein [Thiomicrorhabdus sp. ZW0627]
MEVPITGLIAILLLFLALFIGHKALLVYAVFFMPFSAVAVINFTASENTISYPLFFSLAYLISFLIIKLRVVNVINYKFSLFGMFFILYLIVSNLFVPYVDPSNYYVNEFSYFQVVYLVIGVLLTISIGLDVYKYGFYKAILTTIAWSMLVVSLIGEYQFLSFTFDLYYPSEVFNNSVNPNAQGYTAVLENGMKRISSVSTEPSIFTQWLVVCFSLFIFMKIYGYKLGLFTNIVLINSFIVLMLSTSASAYLGLVSMALISVGLYVYKSRSVLLLGIVLFLTLFLVSALAPFIFDLLVVKLESYSFIERFGSVAFGWEQFIESPLFGMGWGVVTVHSLLVGLLANSGIIGFMMFLYWTLREMVASIRFSKEKLVLLRAQSVLLSILVMMFLQVVTGFVYTYSFFWIILGVLVGENLLAKSYRVQTIK